VEGISAGAAGHNLAAFPSEDHFVSCPPAHADLRGQALEETTQRSWRQSHRGGQRMAATSLKPSKTALGASFRRIARPKGGAVAVLVTAANSNGSSRMLRYGHDYADIGEQAYDRRFQARRLAALTETAKTLGYTLVPAMANG
jgi:transposase